MDDSQVLQTIVGIVKQLLNGEIDEAEAVRGIVGLLHLHGRIEYNG